MTIGIGALATDKNLPKMPNTIVFMADTMGSYGEEFSHQRLHKTFEFHDLGLYATSADRVDRAAELLPIIANNLKLVPHEKRSYGMILQLIAASCLSFRIDLFRVHVLPMFGISPDSFNPTLLDKPELKEAWDEYRIGCDLIIGAFDNEGLARLYTVSGSEETTSGLQMTDNANFPGFAVIGSGSGNAQFWMSKRGHTLGMGVKRAAYHCYEAKLMAESTPTVNAELDCIIAQIDNVWAITTHKESKIPEDCPITFKWLKETFERLGPKPTAELEPDEKEKDK